MADEELTDDDRALIEATCTALGLQESAKTAMLSTTHAPAGKGGTNWITKSKPGNTGQLPAYIQNVRNAIIRDGTEESKATAIAIGKVRDWAEGKGNVGPEVKAAAAKAIAEFDRMRARSKVQETPRARRAKPVTRSTPAGALELRVELGDPLLIETAVNPGVTRYGHPVVASKLPGNQAPKKPKRTRTGMSSEYNASKHPRGRAGQWTLTQGATGDVVRVVQRRVGAKADGQYGAATRQSVMDFQRKHGLKVDGVVGRQTIAAMRGDTNALHVSPGAATLADRRWLHARAAMRRVRENPAAAAPRRRATRIVIPAATGALADLRFGDDLRLVEGPDLAIHEEDLLALVETVEGLLVATDMSLVEAGIGDAMFNADGTIDFVIIRPCHGRGIANAIYESAMLERDAGVFAGLPVFDNHDSEVAKRARRGIPRPPSELAGEIRESWWEPSFATPRDAAMGFDPGGVIGRFMLTDDMERLVRRLPRAVKTSVNIDATGKRPTTRNGKRGMLVEGLFADPERHSVDLVTTAGAGGEVASLYRELVAA